MNPIHKNTKMASKAMGEKKPATKISQLHKAFEEDCKMNQVRKTCNAICGTEIRDYDKFQYNPMDYLCQQKFEEYQKNIPCLHASNFEIQNVCVPKCNGDEQLLQKKINFLNMEKLNIASGQSANVDNLYAHMDEICNYALCTTNCTTPILNSNCEDSQAASIMETFAHISLESHLYFLEQYNIPHPPHCKQIMKSKK